MSSSLESGFLAEEWPARPYHLGPLLGSHPCYASSRPSHEDHQSHEQNHPSVFMVWQSKRKWRHCSVAWETVCMPKWAGGLGIPNLAWLNTAMQARWPWLQRVDEERPWKDFRIGVPKISRALFRAATRATVGDGSLIIFWEDRWMDGMRVEDVAPLIYAGVPRRAREGRRLQDALFTGSWVNDVRPNLNFEALQQYLHLWQQLQAVQLRDGTPDVLSWAWERDGKYSVRSAYASKFAGREVMPTADFTWKSRAPLRCRFFLWIAMKNRCWTSDRLARRGLPHHDTCPFCTQEEETIEHILLTCVFARTIWRTLCTTIAKLEWTPTTQDRLADWCASKPKELRAFATLTLWELWKHRSSIVFEGVSPSLEAVIKRIADEGSAWHRAGRLKGDWDRIAAELYRWARRE